MTREHVFARWLVQQVRGGRLLASHVPPDTASRPTLASPVQVRIARVVAAVCAECNAGWMSTLEESFRKLVFVRPRVGALQAPDRVTLSRWFTKTAALLASAAGLEIIAGPQRRQLVKGMPDDVEVSLGRRRRPRQHLDFALDLTEDPETTAVRGVVAILVDDLLGHVAPPGTLASRHGTRLWPLRTHTIRWETLPVITAHR